MSGLKKQTVKKAELVRDISKRTRVSQKDVGLVIQGLIESIEGFIADDKKVNIIGFASVETTTMASRRRVMPNGQEIITKPRRVASIKLSKAFANKFNDEVDD